MSTKTKPAIILVRPQMGENIGAAARALLNFGLTDLRLVAPRDGWPNPAADALSSGALEHITPTVYDTLAQALADCHYSYATTARSRDMEKPVNTPLSAAQETHQRQEDEQKIAFVFGPERTGLENDEVALCHALIHIPTNPDFASLNLAQSVLLIAYQLFSSSPLVITNASHEAKESQTIKRGDSSSYTPRNDRVILPTPAPHAELDNMLGRLEDELEQRRFFRTPDLQANIMRNIRNLFMRTNMTEQELRTFHGIISALIGNKMSD